jgi:hypothetical protein
MKNACSFITVKKRPCKLSAKRDGLCDIHYKQMIINKHEETQKLLDEAQSKLEIIRYVDELRQGLFDIGGTNQSLKNIIVNPRNRKRIEDLFKVSYKKSRTYFFDLVDQRNKLCHPYTMSHIFQKKHKSQLP